MLRFVEIGARRVIGMPTRPHLCGTLVKKPKHPAMYRVIRGIHLMWAGDYAFKHELVRDAPYQSLLTEQRTAVHSKIAEELERRSGNRLR